MKKLDIDTFFCSECQHYGEPCGCNRPEPNCDAYFFCSEIIDELNAYRNTGLTPEQITQLIREAHNVIRWKGDIQVCNVNHLRWLFATWGLDKRPEATASPAAQGGVRVWNG